MNCSVHMLDLHMSSPDRQILLAAIEEHFTSAGGDIFDASPETETLLNVHRQIKKNAIDISVTTWGLKPLVEVLRAAFVRSQDKAVKSLFLDVATIEENYRH